MEQAAVTTPVSTRLTLPALLRALRPDEWVKNTFVFAALLFGGQFDASSGFKAFGAFVAFCAVASSGYLVNDIRDVDLDRRHPTKRFRAIASGALPIGTAKAGAAALLVAGLAGGAGGSPGGCRGEAAPRALSLAQPVLPNN